MPQYITIKNFGPITSIEKMEVKDFMLFIGERATGKSTIAKWIFFFKEIIGKLKNDFFAVYNNFPHEIDPIQYFFASIDQEFRYTFHSDPRSECTFYYSEDNQNFIQYKNGSFNVGNSFLHFLQKEFSEIQQLKANSESDKDTLSNVKADFFFKQLFKSVDDLYGNDNVFFIPHNRAELIFKNGKEVYRNIINENFEAQIRGAKKWLSVNQNARQSNFQDIQQIIIKGNLYIDSHGEIYISIRGNERVYLSDASSGQQESATILIALEFLLSENYGSITIIEEPESHLDPQAQSLIMEAIALFGNRSIENRYNQVIITTHSPFILNTLSNILYASKLSKEHKEDVEKLGFAPELLLDPERVAVYKCINGGIESIMEDGRVNNEEIDNISSETLHLLDSLIDIELKYENEV
jgi:predicted ATPase